MTNLFNTLKNIVTEQSKLNSRLDGVIPASPNVKSLLLGEKNNIKIQKGFDCNINPDDPSTICPINNIYINKQLAPAHVYEALAQLYELYGDNGLIVLDLEPGLYYELIWIEQVDVMLDTAYALYAYNPNTRGNVELLIALPYAIQFTEAADNQLLNKSNESQCIMQVDWLDNLDKITFKPDVLNIITNVVSFNRPVDVESLGLSWKALDDLNNLRFRKTGQEPGLSTGNVVDFTINGGSATVNQVCAQIEQLPAYEDMSAEDIHSGELADWFTQVEDEFHCYIEAARVYPLIIGHFVPGTGIGPEEDLPIHAAIRIETSESKYIYLIDNFAVGGISRTFQSEPSNDAQFRGFMVADLNDATVHELNEVYTYFTDANLLGVIIGMLQVTEIVEENRYFTEQYYSFNGNPWETNIIVNSAGESVKIINADHSETELLVNIPTEIEKDAVLTRKIIETVKLLPELNTNSNASFKKSYDITSLIAMIQWGMNNGAFDETNTATLLSINSDLPDYDYDKVALIGIGMPPAMSMEDLAFSIFCLDSNRKLTYIYASDQKAIDDLFDNSDLAIGCWNKVTEQDEFNWISGVQSEPPTFYLPDETEFTVYPEVEAGGADLSLLDGFLFSAELVPDAKIEWVAKAGGDYKLLPNKVASNGTIEVINMPEDPISDAPIIEHIYINAEALDIDAGHISVSFLNTNEYPIDNTLAMESFNNIYSGFPDSLYMLGFNSAETGYFGFLLNMSDEQVSMGGLTLDAHCAGFANMNDFTLEPLNGIVDLLDYVPQLKNCHIQSCCDPYMLENCGVDDTFRTEFLMHFMSVNEPFREAYTGKLDLVKNDKIDSSVDVAEILVDDFLYECLAVGGMPGKITLSRYNGSYFEDVDLDICFGISWADFISNPKLNHTGLALFDGDNYITDTVSAQYGYDLVMCASTSDFIRGTDSISGLRLEATWQPA